MKYVKVMLLMLLGLGAKAQSEVSLGDFTSIETSIPVNLQLISSDRAKAAHSKDVNAFSLEISNGVLEIGFKKGVPPSSEPLMIYFVSLKEIEISGAATVETQKGSSIKGESFELECSGAAKANLMVELKKLVVESAGASKITFEGSAEQANIELAGASKYYAANLKTKELKLESAGASTFEVFASEAITVEAAGAVKGTYYGNPITRNINVSGVSNIVDASTGKNLTDERSNPDDTTRISLGKKKFIIIEEGDDIRIEKDGEKKKDAEEKKKELKSVYAGIELGMGSFTSNQLGTALPTAYDFLKTDVSKSWYTGINLYEADLQIVKNKLALTSGLGIEFQNMEFNTDRVLNANVNQISADSGLKAMTRNRLYNFNLSVPLLVKFAPRTAKSNNGFHIAAGVIGTYRAYTHLRLESTAMGYEEEIKIRDDFNTNPFRVSATVRVGYGWFRAFANYNLTPYFNTNNGNPDVRAFTAGLTIIPFDL